MTVKAFANTFHHFFELKRHVEIIVNTGSESRDNSILRAESRNHDDGNGAANSANLPDGI